MPIYDLPTGKKLEDLVNREDLTADQKIRAIIANNDNCLQEQILTQLKILNTYMSFMTNKTIEKDDI